MACTPKKITQKYARLCGNHEPTNAFWIRQVALMNMKYFALLIRIRKERFHSEPSAVALIRLPGMVHVGDQMNRLFTVFSPNRHCQDRAVVLVAKRGIGHLEQLARFDMGSQIFIANGGSVTAHSDVSAR